MKHIDIYYFVCAHLRAHHQLPSRQAIAEQFQMTTHTVNTCMRKLRQMGLIKPYSYCPTNVAAILEHERGETFGGMHRTARVRGEGMRKR